MNNTKNFTNALIDKGIVPTRTINGDGTLHRAHVEGDKAGTLNLAYVLHLDGTPAGWFHHFKTGVTGTWSASGKREPLTPAMLKQIADAKAARVQERQTAHQESAIKANWIWKQAEPITEQLQHQYLVRKRVQPHGTRLYKGSLAIPLMNEANEIVNLQFIHADGNKRFLSGGRKKGCYYLLGGDGSKLLVAEGFATACSLNEQTFYAVYVAFDAGNLTDVAVLATKQTAKSNLSTEVIVCGDNDESGIGQLKAREAALACGGKYLIPNEVGTDWNDELSKGVAHG
ncbi:toprim domain-containing protein [Methyloglobulus sp.]|uniref:toprim domain-containing protein n=1 Tax=Methyloglobulus sp. TaxID=2518622 RepID=UPI0032B78421